MTGVLIGVLTGLLLSQPGGTGVKLVSRLQPGQVLRYDVSSTLEVTAPKGGAERLEQKARVRLTVAEVEEGGEATVRGALESVSVRWKPGDGVEERFEWKEGQELAEDATPLAKAYGLLATTPLELTLGADRSIKAAAGPEKAVAAGQEAGLKNPERLLGVLGPGAIIPTLSPVFGIDPEGKERKPGDTWKVTLKSPGVGAGAVGITVERTLKSVEGGVAKTEGKVSQAWQPGRGRPDPTEPKGAPSDQKGTAREQWDTAAGVLASRTAETSATWKLQLQTMPPIESSRTFTARVELSRVAPGASPKAEPPKP